MSQFLQSAETGFIVACYGAGGLAGAFVAPWVQRRLPAGLTITGCMWVWAIALGVMAAIRVPLWLCPVVVVMGFVGPAWNVSAQTYRMQITPNEMLGRTSSVALQIAWGTIPARLAARRVPATGPVAVGGDRAGRRRHGCHRARRERHRPDPAGRTP